MINIMLDLETLGTDPDAAILSIGACKFDLDGVYDVFHTVIDPSSVKGSIDVPTVMWWMKQSDEARQALTDADETIDRMVALADFSQWIGSRDDVLMWGNGSPFDNVILRSAYDSYKMLPPWNWWNDRCYRTVKSLHRDVPMPEREGVHHNAMDDAVNQAEHLILICKEKGINL